MTITSFEEYDCPRFAISDDSKEFCLILAEYLEAYNAAYLVNISLARKWVKKASAKNILCVIHFEEDSQLEDNIPLSAQSTNSNCFYYRFDDDQETNNTNEGNLFKFRADLDKEIIFTSSDNIN
ncbi:hypothetical protein BpHYR1_036795 [Brachionus plicatilis]|uniref:Uncharacterized protein n=1 Tax=Brachionus plicatilis TaxID=10195 RepID=A0A3M7RYW4_BRAPC|nr:hypothetical protein BpHYR1_036795 [Brachionus plicatilis]